MYSVKLTGFKTPEAAQAFVTWYGEQGEQDIYDVWELWGPRDKKNDPVENIEELLGSAPSVHGQGTWEDKTLVQAIKN